MQIDNHAVTGFRSFLFALLFLGASALAASCGAGETATPFYLGIDSVSVRVPAFDLLDAPGGSGSAELLISTFVASGDGGDLEVCLPFFLHGIEETARASVSQFKSIMQIKERIEGEVLPIFSVRRLDNARRLIRHLYRQPIVGGKAVAQLLETTPNTANSLIGDLVSQGVLNEITGRRRNRLFMFHEYLSLFTR